MFLSVFAFLLVPAMYQTVKTLIISVNSSAEVFDVIGQMEWFDLIDETLRAFLIVPLYAILNEAFKRKDDFAQMVFKSLLFVFALYALFSIGVFVYGGSLIRAMNPDGMNVDAVKNYFRLETVAFVVGIATSFFQVVFVVVGKDVNFYLFLAAKCVLSVIADFILIPRMGIYGIAVSNITVNAVLAAVCFVLLSRQNCIKPSWFQKKDISVLKDWGRIGGFSGVQQFINNFIYAVMICKMVNMVAEQGNYWMANNFIWRVLLIPVMVLAEVIKHDCKDGYAKLNQKAYYVISLAVTVLCAASVPLWKPYYSILEKLPDERADAVFSITLKLAPFYIAYAVCSIISSIFNGLGKTHFNFITSLIVNFVYYGIFFALYKAGKITFTMDTIIMMFGFGMVVNLVITFIEEKVFLRTKIKTTV